MSRITHPYITRDPAGTRFPVRSVVIDILQHGLTLEERVADFPHLTLAQIDDARADYDDNREEIDRDIFENTEEAVRSFLDKKK